MTISFFNGIKDYTHREMQNSLLVIRRSPDLFILAFCFSIHEKGPNKLFSSFTEIKVYFLLVLMYSCRNKAQPKYLVGRLSFATSTH